MIWVMEEMARESRNPRENFHRRAQQGHVNLKAQAGREAETVRLREEMGRMWNDYFRRREVDGGRSLRCPHAVVLGNLVPPISAPSYPQKTWTATGKTGRYAQDSPLPKDIPHFQTQSPRINPFGNRAPGPSTAQYPNGSGAIYQPVFVPISTQDSCPAFIPAMYSICRRELSYDSSLNMEFL